MLKVNDNIDEYSALISKLACGRDYAIGSDGWIEINGRSIAQICIDEDGNLYRGRYFNCNHRWEKITIGTLGAMINGTK